MCHLRISAHHKEEVADFVEELDKGLANVLGDKWVGWCDGVLPCKSFISLNIIALITHSYRTDLSQATGGTTFNDDGIPVFPSTDLSAITADGTRLEIKKYFEAVWGMFFLTSTFDYSLTLL